MFDYDLLEQKLLESKKKTENPKIWEDPDAKLLFKNIKIIEKKLSDFNRIEQSLIDLKEFYKFALDENDSETINQLLLESEGPLFTEVAFSRATSNGRYYIDLRLSPVNFEAYMIRYFPDN